MQHAQRHVLVVDDDPRTRDEFQGYLSAYAFQVSTAPDGAAMKRILAARSVDLVVLDLELGAENGLA